MRSRRRHHGMTLLEVIVAMTVLAVGIAGAVAAVSACVRGSDASASYTRAALLAQQVAAEFDRQATLDAGEQTGTFDDVNDLYRWRAQIDSPNEQGLYPAEIMVLWDNGRKHYSFATLLRPHAVPVALPPAETGGPAQGSGSEPQGANGEGATP